MILLSKDFIWKINFSFILILFGKKTLNLFPYKSKVIKSLNHLFFFLNPYMIHNMLRYSKHVFATCTDNEAKVDPARLA